MNIFKELRSKNFAECKEMATKFKTGDISIKAFEKWSEENCVNCSLYIGKPENKHCIFGKIN